MQIVGPLKREDNKKDELQKPGPLKKNDVQMLRRPKRNALTKSKNYWIRLRQRVGSTHA